jgi:integrase
VTVWFDKGRGTARKKIDGQWVTGGYRFDFWLFGERHTSPRGWDTEQDALDAQAELRRALRRQRAGLEPSTRAVSPTFAETAGAYYAFAQDRGLVTNLDALDNTQFVILQFFGPRPTDPEQLRAGAPYHDLRLQDPIDDPAWILKFEDWMTRRGIAGATKNRYRSAASRLYWFAMLPERRLVSGITTNPFRGLLRDREYPRDVVMAPKDIRKIMASSPYHLRLAIVIAALAPKLRLSNILALKWKTNFDPAITTITIAQHKTRGHTRRPMVARLSGQLQRILEEAKRRQPKKVPWVIHFRGGRVNSVVKALIKACADAKVPYGRAKNAATFHTIRHSAATLLAQLGVPEGLRKDVMGHLSIQTTQDYTHMNPIHELPPLEQLSTQLALEDLVVAPRQLPRAPRAQSHRKSHRSPRRKPSARKHK